MAPTKKTMKKETPSKKTIEWNEHTTYVMFLRYMKQANAKLDNDAIAKELTADNLPGNEGKVFTGSALHNRLKDLKYKTNIEGIMPKRQNKPAAPKTGKSKKRRMEETSESEEPVAKKVKVEAEAK